MIVTMLRLPLVEIKSFQESSSAPLQEGGSDRKSRRGPVISSVEIKSDNAQFPSLRKKSPSRPRRQQARRALHHKTAANQPVILLRSMRLKKASIRLVYSLVYLSRKMQVPL